MQKWRVRQTAAIGLLVLALGVSTPASGEEAGVGAVLRGTELSDTELLEVSGDSLLVTILAGVILGAATGVTADTVTSYIEGNGMPTAGELARSAVGGGFFGGLTAPFTLAFEASLAAAGSSAASGLHAAGTAITTGAQRAGQAIASGVTTGVSVLKSSAVNAARWTARAAVSLGVSTHALLHASVRMPIQNAVTSLWKKLGG